MRLGFEHILAGLDHLLFIAGLTLITSIRKLPWVITGFTIAHSLTLAATSLGLVSLPSGPVEALIALSIVFLAVEAVKRMDGAKGLASTYPWLLSFGFGLLHGFGFAGALGEIGLPAGSELSALLFFNIGVELGQLIFLVALLIIFWVAGRILHIETRLGARVLAYGIGAIGAFWVFERIGGTFWI